MDADSRIVAADLWHALSDALRGFIRARVPSDSDADDVLQTVFMRIIEKAQSLRHADCLESWVYQIARHAIADFYRRRGPRPEIPAEVTDRIAPSDTSDANHNHAVGAWLTSMATQLPDKLRHAVQLYEMEGLSQAEIANRLGISLSGAKSRIQRGRQRLEALLRECCELELDRRGNVLQCHSAQPTCCTESSCNCTSCATSSP